MEEKLKTSVYLALGEFRGKKGVGYVKHNDVATFEWATPVEVSDKKDMYGVALLHAVSSLVEGEEVVEICVNPFDVELVKDIVPDEWRGKVTSCSYNPAVSVVMEKLLGER